MEILGKCHILCSPLYLAQEGQCVTNHLPGLVQGSGSGSGTLQDQTGCLE